MKKRKLEPSCGVVPLTPALGRQRQEDWELKITLDDILSLSLARATSDPVSKNNDSKTECFWGDYENWLLFQRTWVQRI